jgi:SAM-dependent methyltransferase
MDQTKIWAHFQNNEEAGNVFNNALPRYKFIARQVSSGMQVLNIGVGRGGLEAIMLKKRAVVSSLDPGEDAIVRVREKYGLGNRAKVGYSQAIPFADGEFDVVVMSEVLEHLDDDALRESLAEVRRVLKPDGKFVGTVPANENLLENGAVCPHCGASFHRWGHLQTFSLARLSELLASNKLAVRRIETRAFPDWSRKGPFSLLKNCVRYLLGRAGSAIAVPHIYFEAGLH